MLNRGCIWQALSCVSCSQNHATLCMWLRSCLLEKFSGISNPLRSLGLYSPLQSSAGSVSVMVVIWYFLLYWYGQYSTWVAWYFSCPMACSYMYNYHVNDMLSKAIFVETCICCGHTSHGVFSCTEQSVYITNTAFFSHVYIMHIHIILYIHIYNMANLFVEC